MLLVMLVIYNLNIFLLLISTVQNQSTESVIIIEIYLFSINMDYVFILK